MKQIFKEDLNKMLHMIAEAESLAFARFADGEASVLKKKAIYLSCQSRLEKILNRLLELENE